LINTEDEKIFTPDASKSKSKALKIKILTSITVTILQDSTKKLSLLAEEERKLNKKPLCSTVRLDLFVPRARTTLVQCRAWTLHLESCVLNGPWPASQKKRVRNRSADSNP